MTKAKLFTATFNRMMENIKEINVAEIFVAAVDDIDPEAMFDLRGRDLSVVFSDGSTRARKSCSAGAIASQRSRTQHIANTGGNSVIP